MMERFFMSLILPCLLLSLRARPANVERYNRRQIRSIMRSLFAAVLLASAGSGILFAQPLTCPAISTATGRPCDTFHYHVQMYRPDTRGFVDVFGGNQFASQSACDRARDAQFKRNMAVIEF